MRAFIGIDFSMELKKQISELQKELKGYAESGRWKYVDNFHLTLKFLAEVNSEQLNEINRAMKEICSKYDPFTLKISDIGNFPGKGCLRVVWLGLNGEMNRLIALQQNIEERFVNIGFEKENRDYRPHVTIGQNLVMNIGFDEVKNRVKSKNFSEVMVERLYLFKSEQISNKRVYTPISEYLLKQV